MALLPYTQSQPRLCLQLDCSGQSQRPVFRASISLGNQRSPDASMDRYATMADAGEAKSTVSDGAEQRTDIGTLFVPMAGLQTYSQLRALVVAMLVIGLVNAA